MSLRRHRTAVSHTDHSSVWFDLVLVTLFSLFWVFHIIEDKEIQEFPKFLPQLGAATRIAVEPINEKQESRQLIEIVKPTTKHLSKAIRVLVDVNVIDDPPQNCPQVIDVNMVSLEESKAKPSINLDQLMYRLRQSDSSTKLRYLESLHTWVLHIETDQYSEKLVQLLAIALSESHPKVLIAAMEVVFMIFQQPSRPIIRSEDLEMLLVRLFAIAGDSIVLRSKKQIKDLNESIKLRLREYYTISILFGYVSKILQSPEYALDARVISGGLYFISELLPIMMKEYPSDTRIPGKAGLDVAGQRCS